MLTHPPRTARLVLVTPDGNVVGSLRPVSVSTPWWQEVELVVRAVHERYGIEVTILRLLETELESFPGGGVTYLAEVAQSVPAEPWNGILDEQPLRQAYARPGGPAADLAWAASALRERGLLRTGPAVQVRTWNLSSIWRIPVDGQTVWLKVVPPFFAHEGPLLARLAGERVPIVLAQDGGRSLLAEIAGDDQVAAALPLLMEMVTLLVDLQRSWASRTDELLKLGLPDWRASALRVAIPAIIDRTTDQLTTRGPCDALALCEHAPGSACRTGHLRTARHARARRLLARQCPRQHARSHAARLGRQRRWPSPARSDGFPRSDPERRRGCHQAALGTPVARGGAGLGSRPRTGPARPGGGGPPGACLPAFSRLHRAGRAPVPPRGPRGATLPNGDAGARRVDGFGPVF